jgi:hypothetical protein
MTAFIKRPANPQQPQRQRPQRGFGFGPFNRANRTRNRIPTG